MVETETTPLERSGERQMVWPRPRGMEESTGERGRVVAGEVSKLHWKCRRFLGSYPRKHGLVCILVRGPLKLETVFEMWKEPRIDLPRCLGDPCASGMTGRNAGATWSTRERNVRWCRAGCGWLDSYGSGYGRRRGCWSGILEDRRAEWFFGDVGWKC